MCLYCFAVDCSLLCSTGSTWFRPGSVSNTTSYLPLADAKRILQINTSHANHIFIMSIRTKRAQRTQLLVNNYTSRGEAVEWLLKKWGWFKCFDTPPQTYTGSRPCTCVAVITSNVHLHNNKTLSGDSSCA